MESSFSNSLFDSKSPYSSRAHQHLSGRKSLSAFKKSSRLSVSARSNQSTQAILKTQQHSLERFGASLPVLVTEALTFVDRNIAVSAQISSECGFAWIVCGRRLLIWQYQQTVNSTLPGTPRRTGLTNLCYELQLPQSDLSHRAELISVFMGEGFTIPSCIAVSPEGLVRFWPTVAHEGTLIEQQIDLQGQECDSLTGIDGLGCILATTTCTIVLVQPIMSGGRHTLSCKTLKSPSGWLGGISKRMSSLIFGPINTETNIETRTVRVRCVPTAEPNVWNIYVIAGQSLQKWRLSLNEPEQFIYATDLTRIVRDGFLSTHWEKFGGDQSEMDVWILDLQADTNNENLILLLGGVKHQVCPAIHLAFMALDPKQSPTHFSNFYLLHLTGHYSDENPQESMNYRFISSGNAAYVYYSRGIHVVRNHDEDTLEFNGAQEYILCGSICVNTPIFFSRISGLMCVIGNEIDLNTSIASPSISCLDSPICEVGVENLTMYSFDPEDIATAYIDMKGQIKAAFILYIKSQIDSCYEIVNKIIPQENTLILDSNFDLTISTISIEILDDIPANDPRWSTSQVGLGSSYSMQILPQIKDKQVVHTLFVKFLNDVDLWRYMGAITVDGKAIATAHVIAEHREKIIGAIALKLKPNDETVQKAIEEVAKEIDFDADSGLTAQNVFYGKLSKFHKVIVELVRICDQGVHSDMNPSEAIELIQQANCAILDVLTEVSTYRQGNKENFIPSLGAIQLAPDYLPWTASNGDGGIFDFLIMQQDLTYNYGIKCISDYSLQSLLYEQLVSLIDYILDARKSHLESIKGCANENILLKQYSTDRRKLIAPLIEDKRWEEAALLSEKYLDFECLVKICDMTDNQDRLDKYIDRFSRENFSQFVYNWYLQENKQGKLISLCKRHDRNAQSQQDLAVFLSTQPELSWIQNIYDSKYEQAADTLKRLADIEKDSLTKQKTVYSMAKLGYLAAGELDESDVLKHIDNRLTLIACQEELPDYILQLYGYDNLKPCVMEPKDLIHLYTCAEYSDATEVDFKKSLDLLMFITDEKLRDELMLHIWKNAILRDSWDDNNLDSPLEALQKKLMFKIVDLALVLGSDRESLLPPLKKLLNHPDLLELQNNKTFEYLIRTGYEQAFKALEY